MSTRRVVTGVDATDKSVVASDTQVAPFIPEDNPTTQFTMLWGADAPPHFPQSGEPPAMSGMFPGPGGYRFGITRVEPGVVFEPAKALTAEQRAEIDRRRRLNPDDVLEADTPGMHRSDTVDLEIVISGEMTVELDDGKLVHLQAGDTFIQNGTRHRWSNRGDVPAVMAVVVIGGHPRP